MKRPTLNKRAFSCWLGVEDAERLQALARDADQEAGRHMADLIRPYLDAEDDEVVIPLRIERKLYEHLKSDVEYDIENETDEDFAHIMGLDEPDIDKQIRYRIRLMMLLTYADTYMTS